MDPGSTSAKKGGLALYGQISLQVCVACHHSVDSHRFCCVEKFQ
jgi:mono/diheme cytochrome c family protein